MFSNNIESGAGLDTAVVDLNKTLREVLKQLEPAIQSRKPLLRCDELPIVQGDNGKLVSLFSNLIQLILSHTPRQPQLFIHIKSALLPAAEATHAGGGNWSSVSIHANILYEGGWEKKNAAALQYCASVCNQIGARFVYHLVSTTSCLFTINFPENKA